MHDGLMQGLRLRESNAGGFAPENIKAVLNSRYFAYILQHSLLDRAVHVQVL